MKILRESGCNTNSEDESMRSSFGVSCAFGRYDILQYLIECEEIDKNKPDCVGQTPFQVACQEGHVKIVKLLFENDVNISTLNNYDESPFETACYYHKLSVVSFLLNFDVEITDKCIEYGQKKSLFVLKDPFDDAMKNIKEEMSKRSLILS